MKLAYFVLLAALCQISGCTKGKLAVEDLCNKAKEGDRAAQYSLSKMYHNGDRVRKDGKSAFEWSYKSAHQGYVKAELSLALCYFTGEGVEKDLKEAFRWFVQAAKDGDMYAPIYVGYCLNMGYGIEEDESEAAKWYFKALTKSLDAKQVDTKLLGNVQRNLAVYFFRNKNGDGGCKVARNWYLKAAESGDAIAMHWISWDYACGCCVHPDLSQSKFWEQKARENGYERGVSMERDFNGQVPQIKT